MGESRHLEGSRAKTDLEGSKKVVLRVKKGRKRSKRRFLGVEDVIFGPEDVKKVIFKVQGLKMIDFMIWDVKMMVFRCQGVQECHFWSF